MNRKLFCTICLILGIMLFSTIEISGKVIASNLAALNVSIDPMPMVFARFFITGIILVAIGLPGYLKKQKLNKNDILIFLLNGFLGVFCSLYLFHLGISLFENASSAAVVFSANALFTCILAKYINNEELTIKKLIAVFMGLVGVSLFIFEKGSPSMDTLFAMLVMSASAFMFAASVCITRRVVKKYGSILYMGMTSLFGAAIALPFCYIINGGLQIDAIRQVMPSMSYMVFMGTTLSYLLYYTGLSGVSAFQASMTFFMKPCLACIFAWLYLGNRMNAWTYCGTAIIIFAMFLTLNLKKSSSEALSQKNEHGENK